MPLLRIQIRAPVLSLRLIFYEHRFFLIAVSDQQRPSRHSIVIELVIVIDRFKT